MLKVSWRLLPLIVVCYLMAYIDRTNVSFAALTMNRDLGLTAYMLRPGRRHLLPRLCAVRSAEQHGPGTASARAVWIARIMITWGIISGLMAAATGPVSFLVLRFLLGVAEAGFFPGIIFYLTFWFPAAYRARVISTLFIAVPVSNAIASIVSGAILEMDGTLGLRGWQWVFILEAIPAVLLAFVVLRMLTERPASADLARLPTSANGWRASCEAERSRVERAGRLTILQTLTDPRVLALSADLLHQRHRQLRHRLLPAADHQGPGPHQPDDRPGDGDSVRDRRRSACCCGAILRIGARSGAGTSSSRRRWPAWACSARAG